MVGLLMALGKGPPRPPTGLQPAGRKLWREVMTRYVLTPAEASTLGEACRTSDEIARLEVELRGLESLLTTGSTGQVRAHPLLGELRSHRVLLDRLTTSLALPAEGQETGETAASRRNRHAAQVRWRDRSRKEGGTDGGASEAGRESA